MPDEIRAVAEAVALRVYPEHHHIHMRRCYADAYERGYRAADVIARLREAEAVIEKIDDLTTRHYLDTSAGRAIYEITGAYYKTTKTESTDREVGSPDV